MSQREIEVILARQLAEYLILPIFIVDPQGELLYYNESAEDIIGIRYDETGPMPASEWSTKFEQVDLQDKPMKPEDLPLMIAMTKLIPSYSRFRIIGLDKIPRELEMTAFPLIGQGDRYLGAIAIFWEVPK